MQPFPKPESSKPFVVNQSNSMGLTPDRLQELAADERNQVYEFKYDTVERVLPCAEVRTKLQALRGVIEQQRAAHPEWKWADHKAHVQQHYPVLWDMRRTHPKLFDVVSHPDAPPKEMQLVYYTIAVKERVEQGKLTDMEARHYVSDRLIGAFRMEKGKTEADATPWGVSDRPDAKH